LKQEKKMHFQKGSTRKIRTDMLGEKKKGKKTRATISLISSQLAAAARSMCPQHGNEDPIICNPRMEQGSRVDQLSQH
jgi:hypothetical protein